jgi:hypothetical protein
MRFRASHLPRAPCLDGNFTTYEILDIRPRRNEVLHMLRRLAHLVRPIMLRRGWKIPTLTELPLDSPDLGNMTAVQHVTLTHHKLLTTRKTTPVCENISLRIRCLSRPDRLVPIDVVMQTLLHELAHIGYCGHGVTFYRRNAKLLRELERDWRQGLLKRVDGREIPRSVADVEQQGAVKRLLIAL